MGRVWFLVPCGFWLGNARPLQLHLQLSGTWPDAMADGAGLRRLQMWSMAVIRSMRGGGHRFLLGRLKLHLKIHVLLCMHPTKNAHIHRPRLTALSAPTSARVQ